MANFIEFWNWHRLFLQISSDFGELGDSEGVREQAAVWRSSTISSAGIPGFQIFQRSVDSED